MNIKTMLSTPSGSIIISILLGLGLAAVFRRACNGNRCIVIKGPSPSEVAQNYYKVNSNCYKYTPVFTECDAHAMITV